MALRGSLPVASSCLGLRRHYVHTLLPGTAAPRLHAPSAAAAASRHTSSVQHMRKPASRCLQLQYHKVQAMVDPLQAAWLGPDAPPANGASRNVVAVVDHTAASKRAVSWALSNIYRQGDVLHILHVVPPEAAMANGLTGHMSSFECGDEVSGRDLVEKAKENIERAFAKKVRGSGNQMSPVDSDAAAEGLVVTQLLLLLLLPPLLP